MRYAFIKTLTELAKKDPRIMLLTGDLGFTVFEDFAMSFPKQFINVGVAEANMTGVATGLALSGKIPFIYSIATFSTMRPYEQIRTDVAVHRANVKIIGSGAGLSYSDAGPTHHAIEDISLMRGIPNMTVICPADPIETAWATLEAANKKGPFYLRLGKKGEPMIHKDKSLLRLGEGMLFRKGNKAAIFATGNIVKNVLDAADILKGKGIEITVVDLHTLKPLDKNLINKIAKEHSKIFTAEEHLITGGLGSAVAEVISESGYNSKLIRIGIPDIFISEMGKQDYLRRKFGLDPEGIANLISKAL
ncbi:MAG: hypothetical protein A2857_05185 [Candidatus Levybacteria bacterium RIFCSPHIGHO2_01_FULL_36_15]|nr:MAG: hypothetical protein A2857_05185 [Candidatus Levybacteria bacterium RIFCSPHIGHO2_01_FULL_36_15]OGH38452.1 MAG: hypothetical protein A2905_01435 [Candidatus Levybacteria bacterium RIFCSPLOWO2_01_FULL_36_10]